MSAHRTHFTPPAAARRRHSWRGLLIAIGTAAVLAVITVAASQGREQMGPAARPASLFEVPGTPALDGPTLAEIRVESFRAGYANAVQDGCRPAVTFPLARAQ